MTSILTIRISLRLHSPMKIVYFQPLLVICLCKQQITLHILFQFPVFWTQSITYRSSWQAILLLWEGWSHSYSLSLVSIHGLSFMVYHSWFVIHGLSFMIYHSWFIIRGLSFMLCRSCHIIHITSFMARGFIVKCVNVCERNWLKGY